MLLGLLLPLCLFTLGLLAADNPNPQTTNDPSHYVHSGETRFSCMTQRRSGVSKLVAPDRTHCAHALDQILKADKADAPMLISHTEGFLVPHKWSEGSCEIYIDTASDKPVTLPLTAVVRVGLVLMQECIDKGPGLGGAAALGSQDDSGAVLQLVVFGLNKSLFDVNISPAAQMAAAEGRSFGSVRPRRV